MSSSSSNSQEETLSRTRLVVGPLQLPVRKKRSVKNRYILQEKQIVYYLKCGSVNFLRPLSARSVLPTVRFSLQQRCACQTSSCNGTPMSSASIFNNVCAGMLLVTGLLAERLHTMRELNASEWDDK